MKRHQTWTGALPDGTQLLLETWPDGSATIATRSHSWATWGPPMDLHRGALPTSSEVLS